MQIAAFTICARNYLPRAETLKDSLQRHDPDLPFFIFLADEAEPSDRLPGGTVPIASLDIPGWQEMAFRYTLLEFSTSLKADCFLYLLRREGFDAAIFLDPDIEVFSPLSAVREALAEGQAAVLTPHLLDPYKANLSGRDLEIVRSGAFNLGFAAFSRQAESLAFLDWWAAKLRTQCYAVPEAGLFVDQRFCDMAPAFIEHLCILRHPGYNVAYWNLQERAITREGSEILVNGAPLVFFHFSGLGINNAGELSHHLGADQPEMSTCLAGLVQSYSETVKAYQEASGMHTRPYAYGRFANGMAVLQPMRRDPPAHGSPQDWFLAPDTDYWNSPDPHINDAGPKITRLMGAYLRLRPDLMQRFPMTSIEGRSDYLAWFCRHGVREYDIPDCFLPGGRLGALGATGAGLILRTARSLMRRAGN